MYLLKKGNLTKKAFVGMTLDEVTPDDLGKDYSSKQLNRMIRKHPKLKLPQTKMDAEIAKGVENLSKKVPKITYQYSSEGAYLGEHGGEGTVRSPSSKGLIVGHELTHGVDRLEKGQDFMGNRGMFGLGGNGRSQLESEASASKGIIDQLSKKTQRARGAILAHSYDTYDASARINPLGNALVLTAPTKEIGNAWSVKQELSKGFLDPLPDPEKKHIFSHPAGKILDKASLNSLSLAKLDNMARSRGQRKAARTRTEKNINLENEKAITKTIKGNTFVASHNRKTLIKNLVKSPKQYDGTINSEVHRYIKETRKTFGPSVARGVIADIRGIRDEVNVIRDKNKAIAYQAKPSTKVKNFFTNVFNKVKGLK